MALLCVYSGYKYNEIYEMPYIRYNDLLTEIGILLNYKAIVNILGGGFVDMGEVFKMVEDANPIFIKENKDDKGNKRHEKLTLNKLREMKMI